MFVVQLQILEGSNVGELRLLYICLILGCLAGPCQRWHGSISLWLWKLGLDEEDGRGARGV